VAERAGAIHMNRLCELAMKFGTDKTPYWNNCTGHCYTPFYEDLFRGKNITRILEIGICTGASLRMWKEYFPEARIFGIDNNPFVLFNAERITTACCDAGNSEVLDHFISEMRIKFDLIIDDGSHLVKDQITAAQVLIPYLTPHGMYIIEDVQEGTEDEVASKIGHPYFIVHPVSDIAPHRSDDTLIVAWRKE
jgi:SAM-dependent methyltransferase